jgi:transposase
LTLDRSLSIGEEEGLVGVEQWAVLRRMHRVDGLSGREISRPTGLARDMVARLLAASEPPK